MKRLTQQLPHGHFWTYFTAAIFFNFGFALFAFLFHVYLLGLGFNERTLGVIGSCSLTGRLLATLPLGWLAGRFGLRATLVSSVAIAICCTFFRVTVPAHSFQFFFAFCAGACLSAWAVCLPPAVAALTTEERRPFAFSLIFASGIGDAGFGAYAAGHLPSFFSHRLLTAIQSERAVLYFGCAIAALSLVPLSLLKVPTSVILQKAPRLKLPSDPFLQRFLLATAVWTVVLGAFPPFANIFFTKHLKLPLGQMGSILATSQAIQFVAILFAPLIFRRTSLAVSILVTQLLTSAALFSLGGAHTLMAASVSYWIYTAAQNSNEPAIASLLMDRVVEPERNAASSFTLLVTAGAQILASSAVGAGIVHFGYSPVLYAIAILALVAAALYFCLPGPEPALA